MKLTCTPKNTLNRHYVPPAAGNGSLVFQIDYEGEMKPVDYCFMRPVILRSGYRNDNSRMDLMDFGYFDQELPDAGNLLDWRQTLDTDTGLCECECHYASGLTVLSRIFCSLDRNIIAIRKIFTGHPDAPEFRFRYHLPAGCSIQPDSDGSGLIRYPEGWRTPPGHIRMTATPALQIRNSEGICEAAGSVAEADILLAFDEETDETWDELHERNRRLWQDYNREGFLSLPDESLMQTYAMAQYHLRIFSTPWSIPTGLFHGHWEGRFFAYDEFYTHGALLTSGHFTAAAKIDRFRASILDQAFRRTCFRAHTPPENLAARYPWETREDGTEGTPPGIWMDCYVHMANAAFSAWETYLFTRNMGLLKEVLYPVMHACAECFRRSAVYYDSVTGPYIGKCTDMEVFGEFIERPYATTCGIIAVFQAAAAGAELLDRDAGLRSQWKKLADELHAALPQQDGRYIPYAGFDRYSISIFHGVFPYGVIAPENPLQGRGMDDAMKHFHDFAGQYKSGGSLSMWYAATIATAEIRRGNCRHALQLLQEAARSETGCFHECFEVYERQKLPWFSTAAGAFIRAINELAIRNSGLADPIWQKDDYAYKLFLPDGKTAVHNFT